MARIQVNLMDVVCRDGEDLFSADEFYLTGAISDGLQTTGVLTWPLSINAGESKLFGVGGGVIFDADIPEDRVLAVSLIAFEQFSDKNWSNHEDVVLQIGEAVSSEITVAPDPYMSYPWLQLSSAVKTAALNLDMAQDQKLGYHTRQFPIWALPPGNHLQIWSFHGTGRAWLSDWDYTVRYMVVKK